jgi:hypothetical protein
MKKYDTTDGYPQGVVPIITKKKYTGLSASIHAHSVR